MLKRTLFVFAIAGTLITACKPRLSKEILYGEWKYIKIDHPNGDNQADTVTAFELAEQNPYITFKPQNQLIINWGGKILSRGTFEIKDDNINYTEQLPDGKTRTFPFFVSKLDAKSITFETLGSDGSRVVAVKK